MRTLNVSISDIEFNKFGLKQEQLTFTDILDLVSQELMRQQLNQCFGLSENKQILNMLSNAIKPKTAEANKKAKKKHH